MSAGARNPRGKMTQPHKLGSSSATCLADASRAGGIDTALGIGLPSLRATETVARACKYDSGGTAVLPNQTEVGTRPSFSTKSATSSAVRKNWFVSTVIGPPSVDVGCVGPKGLTVNRTSEDRYAT